MKALPLLRLHATDWWPLAVPLFIFGVLCTVGVLALPMQDRNVQLAVLLAQAVAAIWGAASCFQAMRRASHWDERLRRAWLLLGLALGCFAAGALTYFATGLLGTSGRTSPSAADIFRVIQQPLMWVALVSLASIQLRRAGQGLGSVRVIFDAAIVALAFVVLYWTVLIEPILARAQPFWSKAIWFFYAGADIVSLFAVVLLLFSVRGHLRFTRAAGLLFLGIAAFAITNFIHLYQSLHQLRPAGALSTPDDIGWIWAVLLIGAAALAHSEIDFVTTKEIDESGQRIDHHLAAAPGDPEAEGATHREQAWQQFTVVWLPYVTVLLVTGVLIWDEVRSGRGEALVAMLPVLVLLLAIVGRQMLTLWENMQLYENLRSANLSLENINSDWEQNVQERTQHLSTLHGITSTLNTSLDRRTVLRVALERTMSATQADGGGIWLRIAEEETSGVEGDDGTRTFWELAHSSGFSDNEAQEHMLRDLAIAAAEEQGKATSLLNSARLAHQDGFAPSPSNTVLVPIRWGGALLGTLGLLRHQGAFTYEDRALVESVALETGTALQNARLYQEARHRADRDSVTALLNHRAVQERLVTELQKARRGKTELAVVMMDLDNFKFFNDTYGHPTGDEVLRTVARFLREVSRESDTVGRYGGDEFIALLPESDAAGAHEFTRRVATRLDEHHFQANSGSRIPIEMAFGLAVFPRDADSALELLTAADANLYESKHSGGLNRTPARIEANEQSRSEVRKLKNRSAGGSFGVLDALVTTIDNKDHYTRRHSEEVTHYSLLVARELGYSAEALRAVRISGLLHDVGKIAVPDDILRHPGQLGPDEWEIMRQHPVFGALIVKDLPHLDEVLDGVRHHHERWDGKGYPDGLREDAIPMMGRLLAVGDCFSAMTTNRPYRKAFSPEDALSEIERAINIQFDPTIAMTFIKVMRRELESMDVQGEGSLKPGLPEISDEVREEIALLPNER